MTIKQISESPKVLLRNDSLVVATVGSGADGETKVYTGIAKTDVTAPFVVINQVPLLSDDGGVYGDDHVLVYSEFQITSWGRTEQEAWILASMCDEAVVMGDWAVDPYSLMKVRREGMPVSLPDRDTDLRQVQARYLASFSR